MRIFNPRLWFYGNPVVERKNNLLLQNRSPFFEVLENSLVETRDLIQNQNIPPTPTLDSFIADKILEIIGKILEINRILLEKLEPLQPTFRKYMIACVLLVSTLNYLLGNYQSNPENYILFFLSMSFLIKYSDFYDTLVQLKNRIETPNLASPINKILEALNKISEINHIIREKLEAITPILNTFTYSFAFFIPMMVEWAEEFSNIHISDSYMITTSIIASCSLTYHLHRDQLFPFLNQSIQTIVDSLKKLLPHHETSESIEFQSYDFAM